MSGCIVIKDRFGDCHARQLPSGVECNAYNLRQWAKELAEDCCLEDGESYRVGLCSVSDPGLARLRDRVAYEDGGIAWETEPTRHSDTIRCPAPELCG